MLRRSHGWSLIKLRSIRLKKLSEAASKSTKNVKMNSCTGNFHSKCGHRLFSFLSSFSIEHRRWLLMIQEPFLKLQVSSLQNKILRKWTHGFPASELRVSSYVLRVTIYCTSYDLIFTYELRVAFYILVTSNYVLHQLRVKCYERVTSYYLLHELRFDFYIQVANYYLLHELQL